MSDWKKPPFLRDAREASLSEGMRRLSGIALDIRAGTQLSAQDLDFVATAFEAIIAGGDPATSLGIRGKAGRPGPDFAENIRRAQIAAKVIFLKNYCGKSIDEAVEKVSKEFSEEMEKRGLEGPKEDTIRGYLKEVRKNKSHLLDLFVQQLRDDHAGAKDPGEQ